MKHHTCFNVRLCIALSGWLVSSFFSQSMSAQNNRIVVSNSKPCKFTLSELSNIMKTQPLKEIDTSKPPQWRHFWEFGDGTYYLHGQSFDTSYSYRSVSIPGGSSVRVNSVPIYSGNDKPSIARLSNVTGCDNNSLSPVVNFGLTEALLKLKADVNWNAAEINDTMTVALSLRDSSPQLLRMKVISGTLELVDTIRRPTGIVLREYRGRATTLNAGDTRFWLVDGLSGTPSHTIFMDFKVLNAVRDSLLVLEFDLLPTPSGTSTNNTNDNNGINFIDLLLGNQEQVSNPQFIYNTSADANANDRVAIRVNAARDPNSILVSPLCIVSGQNKHKLTYTVHFENLGSGNADTLSVYVVIDTVFLDRASLSDTEFYFESENADSKGAGMVPGGVEWTFSKGGKLLIPLLSNSGGSGWLNFSIETHKRNLRHGEQIVGQALIQMGKGGIQDSVWTNLAITTVSRQCRFCLPSYWGIKGGMNYQNADFSGLREGGGWHAGVSWRRALTCLPDEYRFKSAIPYGRMPRLWYQAELMLNRLGYVESNADRYRYWMLDMVPLQIRYLLGSVGGPLNNKIAVSAGYRLSFCADAQVNENQVSLDGGRFEHGLFSDIAIFNIIGSPGLSLGWRYHHRLSQVLPTEVGNYFQLYAHFNF